MNRIQNEHWLNALPDEAVNVAEEINIEIARVIAERIKTIGELSPSDVKKLTNSLQYLGADFGKITKLIAKYCEKGQMAVVSALEAAADGNDEFADVFYSARGIAAHTRYNDDYLRTLVEAMTRQTAAEFTNLSQTLAYKINDKTISLRQMYTRTIDKAIYEVQSGTVDYHTAMRKTVKQLSGSMRILKWESGHTRRLDSHIRQNLVDGIKQLQTQMLDYHAERFGSDGVEISAHAISAPDHVAVQGRQFSNDEFYKMQNDLSFKDVNGNEYKGFARPIGQWNCRHIEFPIIIGISEPVHTEEQLKEFAENSKRKYDLTQQQRAMETKLRQLKAERLTASAAGDELEAKRIQRKINEQQTIYRRFSEKHNLLYDTQRASVDGYRRISVKGSQQLENVHITTKSSSVSPLGIDVTENGKYRMLPYKYEQYSDYENHIRPEYDAQNISSSDNNVLWNKDYGYIQNQTGYGDINKFKRGIVNNIDEKYEHTIEILDRVTNNHTLKHNYVGFRKVDAEFLENVMGIDVSDKVVKRRLKTKLGKFRKVSVLKDKECALNIADKINSLVGTENAKVLDKGYMSISLAEDINYFTHLPIRFDIQIPMNTKGFITDNWTESEYIARPGSVLDIMGAEVYNDGEKDCIRILSRIIQN